MPKKTLKLAIVEWEDAQSLDDKSTFEDMENETPCLVKSYGLLKVTNKYHIILTFDGGQGNSEFTKIPNCLVRKVTYLKL